MKTDHAIRINKGRERLPAGGPWKDLDPVAQGRVQLLRVNDAAHEAVALVDELLRLKQRNPTLSWSDCAVLANKWDELAPVRALCEQRGIPIICAIDGKKSPPLYRVREVRQFFAALKTRHDELLSATNLLLIIGELTGGRQTNIWWELLRSILQELGEESGDAQLPMSYFTEYIYESLAEQRRERAVGSGVFLSTVHSAKGMEFPHVLVPGGGWKLGRVKQEQEEERRVYYVAMTRAKETLCLFERAATPNPHTGFLSGDFLLEREPAFSAPPDNMVLRRKYEILGMADLFLDYAGRRRTGDPVHDHLSRLRPGDILFAKPKGESIELHDKQGVIVAQLSRSASHVWGSRLNSIERITVLAMVHRTADDSGEDYRDKCQCEQWEVPVAEVVYLAENSCSVGV